MKTSHYQIAVLGGLFLLVTAEFSPGQTSAPDTSAAIKPVSVAEKVGPVAPSASSQQVLSSADNDYVLTPGDKIGMTIFGEPDLTSQASIGRDGTLQLPLIEEVKLAGLTIRDARKLLRKLYAEKYLRNPQVNIDVVTFAKRSFTILGQITNPGSYKLEGGETITLLEAIGMAGGFTRIADHGHILIKRSTNNSEQALKANAKRMADGRDKQLMILPGDVITVGESWY